MASYLNLSQMITFLFPYFVMLQSVVLVPGCQSNIGIGLSERLCEVCDVVNFFGIIDLDDWYFCT